MFSEQRVFLSKSDVFTDISSSVSDYIGSNATIDLAANDYIYLATEAPFNSRYFEFTTPSDVDAGITVEVWNNREWFQAVDVVDLTSGFLSSGALRFALDRYGNGQVWAQQDSKYVADVPTSLYVFGKYWMRLKVTNPTLPTTALKFIGLLFSTDEDLYSLYPELRNANLRNAWETGKTTWKTEAFSAADNIILEMRARGILKDRSGFSIMETDVLRLPSIHKTAEIIFRGLGPAFAPRVEEARKEFNATFNMKYFDVDINGDGQLSKAERQIGTGFVGR